MPIVDEINHHNSPGGPAGIHSAPPINSVAIWKFSKNVQLAKDFLKFLFQKENYDAWIVASNAFNHPRSEEHTSELQSHSDLVCRLLLEKKKTRENRDNRNNQQDR